MKKVLPTLRTAGTELTERIASNKVAAAVGAFAE